MATPFLGALKNLSWLAMDQGTKTEELKELLCFNLYSLNLSFGRYYSAAFAETGLTYPKFVILMALDAEGPLSISALSKKAGVEANTISPLLKKMAEFGAITRKRAKDDDRRVEVNITPMGEEILERARSVIAKGFKELQIDSSELTKALQFLEKTRAKVDQADPPKLNFDGIE